MGYSKSRTITVVGLSLMTILGCAEEKSEPALEPIDSTEATTTTNERVDTLLTGLADSMEQVETEESSGVAADALDAVFGGDACVGTTSAGVDASESAPKEATDSLNELLTRVRDEAKEHVFREDLVESDDGKQVIYKMDPVQTCGEDPSCVTKLTQNPLRFAVTANADDSLNVDMLVGEGRNSPAHALMSSTKLTVTGNLEKALASLRLFVDAEEQDELPDVFSGEIEWSLEKIADGRFVVSTAILEKLDVVIGRAKNEPVAVTVQPTKPTSRITVDSSTKTIGFEENLGAIDVSVAGSALCGEDGFECGDVERTGNFGLHLAGLSGAFSATTDATAVTFSDLGLGTDTSTLSVNGKPLVAVDVNEEEGRKLSMRFEKTTGGTLVTFEPALDLQVAMALTNLSESMRVDMPEWLFDEVFAVTLGGAPKPSILIPKAVCGATGETTISEQLEVIAGKLTLSASSLTAPVEVGAGMCLVPVDDVAEDSNPISRVSSGGCE